MKSHERYLQALEKHEHLEFVSGVLSNFFGRPIKSDDDLANAVYKSTYCGAWGKVLDNGDILFGSIIEGSDAEVTADAIKTWEKTEEEIHAKIAETLEWIEAEADILWNEANEETEDFCQPSNYTGPYTAKQAKELLEDSEA